MFDANRFEFYCHACGDLASEAPPDLIEIILDHPSVVGHADETVRLYGSSVQANLEPPIPCRNRMNCLRAS